MSVYALVPNLLSGIRLFLAPVVLFCPSSWRAWLLVIAGVTDILDGYLARRWKVSSQLGAILDPLGDKAFIFSLMYVLWGEGRLKSGQIAILFSRDIALILFAGLLVVTGRWSRWTIRAFWCGKAATALQIVILSLVCLSLPIPTLLFGALLLVGGLALPELILRRRLIGDRFGDRGL